MKTFNRLLIFIFISIIAIFGLATIANAEGPAYIVVHALNPEGVEISSIEGAGKVEIYDGDNLIGYGTAGPESHNTSIMVGPGKHLIKAVFNGMIMEQNIDLKADDVKVLRFTFSRTEFDIVSWINSLGINKALYSSFSTPFKHSPLGDHEDAGVYSLTLRNEIGFSFGSHPDLLTGTMYNSFSFTGNSFELKRDVVGTFLGWWEYGGAWASSDIVSRLSPIPMIDFVKARSDFKYWFVQEQFNGVIPGFTIWSWSDQVRTNIIKILPNPNIHPGWYEYPETSTTLLLPTSINFDGSEVSLPPYNYGWGAGTGVEWAGETGTKEAHLHKTGTIEYWKMSSIPYDLKGTGIKDKLPPEAVLDYIPSQLIEGQKASFDGSSSTDSDGIIAKYEWDFDGDGNYDYSESPIYAPDGVFDGKTTFTYSAPGNYNATLRVTDNDSLSDTASKNVTVLEIKPPVITTNVPKLLTLNSNAGNSYKAQFSVYNPNPFPIFVNLYAKERRSAVELDEKPWAIAPDVPFGPDNTRQILDDVTQEIQAGEEMLVYEDINHKFNWIEPLNLDTLKKILKNTGISALLDRLKEGLSWLHLAQQVMEPVYSIDYSLHPSVEYWVEGEPIRTVVGKHETTRIEPSSYKLSLFSNSLATGATASSFTTLALSGAGVPAALAEVYWLVCSITSYKIAADPPDYNYTSIAEIIPLSVPEIDEITDSTQKQTIIKLFDIMAVEEAMYTSFNRYEGARSSGDSYWAAKQYEAALAYAMEAAMRHEAISSELKTMLADFSDLSDDEIADIKEKLATEGLPSVEVSALTRFGFTQTQMDQIRDSLINMDNGFYKNFSKYGSIIDNHNYSLKSINDSIGPQYPSIIINKNSDFTRSKGVSLELSASDDVVVFEMMVSNSSSFSDATWEVFSSKKNWTLLDNDGKKMVYAKFKDMAGNESGVAKDTIFLDTNKPLSSVMAPTISTKISANKVFKVSWSGKDPVPSSGINLYDLQYKVNSGGVWKSWKTGITSTYADFNKGFPGQTIDFRARARDKAGNISNWSSAKQTIIPYDDSALIYSSGWKDNDSLYSFKNTLKYTEQQSSYATFVFTGKSVTLIAPKGKNNGKLDVYIRDKVNGVWSGYKKVKTIDLYSATSKSRVPIPIRSWTSKSTHQVKFIATGDKNANALGKKVVIDGLAILK